MSVKIELDLDSRCDCGHARRSHANGEFECKFCRCLRWTWPTVPDIFEDVPDPDPSAEDSYP